MTVTTRQFEPADSQAIVELSLCAWGPVFASLRAQLGDAIFLRLYPDWAAGQAEAVRASCTSDGRHVIVAVTSDDRPVGFVAVALDADARMGAVDMTGVDPEYQRRGIARELMRRAADHMRAAGMDIPDVETGGGPGHARARTTYEAIGYTLLPIARLLHAAQRVTT